MSSLYFWCKCLSPSIGIKCSNISTVPWEGSGTLFRLIHDCGKSIIMIWYTCLGTGEILFAGLSRLVGEVQGPGKEVNTFWETNHSQKVKYWDIGFGSLSSRGSEAYKDFKSHTGEMRLPESSEIFPGPIIALAQVIFIFLNEDSLRGRILGSVWGM